MIGIIAPSSKVPVDQLKSGVNRLSRAGFSLDIQAQCLASDLFFAGSDQDRAHALFDLACSTDHSVIWAARGGYGSVRILPLLDQLTVQLRKSKKGRNSLPHKLLVGFSDPTALMEYVRIRWGWSVLHAPMIAGEKFGELKGREWKALLGWVRRDNSIHPSWQGMRLHVLTPQYLKKTLQASLVGGNLTVWQSLMGTPYEIGAKNSFVFFEDVGENLYRIDRIVQQLKFSNALAGAKAIILGNFLNCQDQIPAALKKDPLRKLLPSESTLKRIFLDLGNYYRIPVAWGLPVGHGPGIAPLPLGAQYELNRSGKFQMLSWDWVDRNKKVRY